MKTWHNTSPVAILIVNVVILWASLAWCGQTEKKAKGLQLKAEFVPELGVGYTSNPQFLPPGDTSLAPSISNLFAGLASMRLMLPDGWDTKLSSELSIEPLYNAMKYSQNMFILDWDFRKGLWGTTNPRAARSSYLGIGYKYYWNSNSPLSNPDRADSHSEKMGYSFNRVEGFARLGPDWSLFGVKAQHDRKNFEELSSLVASLDQLQNRIQIDDDIFILPFLRIKPEYTYTNVQYVAYPARNQNGKRDSSATKSYVEHALGLELDLNLTSLVLLSPYYYKTWNHDDFQSYFDYSEHKLGINGKWELGKAISVECKAEERFLYYKNYHTLYNPSRPIKRVQYNKLQCAVRYSLKNLDWTNRILWREEKNTSAIYEFKTLELFSSVAYPF